MTLEQYDLKMEGIRARSLQRELERADREGLAVQAALSQHRVVKYVKRLPVEPAAYPAIKYLASARGLHIDNPCSEGEDAGTAGRGGDGMPLAPWRPYIAWCMPARDKGRPVRKGCGLIRTQAGDLVYSACPTDEEHHLKAKRRHCWSLRCPSCMNDTALRQGVRIEKRLLTYAALVRKRGADPGRIGHWMVSPPQEAAKALCQDAESFSWLCRRVDGSMQAFGATAGVSVFHPWRQDDEEWRFSPHFHILCYGRIDTSAFRRANPGWVIKKIHAREGVRSIRHTAAYLMTHMGLALYERDPDEVDWGLDVLDMMIPGVKSPGADYGEGDWSLAGEGKGRMSGDLSEVDWVEWTMRRLSGEIRMRWWGGCSIGRIRTLDVSRRYKVRLCRECRRPIKVYEGCGDAGGSPVRYIRDDPVSVFAEDYELVMAEYKRCKASLRAEGRGVEGFAASCRLAVSASDLGLPPDTDLDCPPFSEPDMLLIRRQRRAFGGVHCDALV